MNIAKSASIQWSETLIMVNLAKILQFSNKILIFFIIKTKKRKYHAKMTAGSISISLIQKGWYMIIHSSHFIISIFSDSVPHQFNSMKTSKMQKTHLQITKEYDLTLLLINSTQKSTLQKIFSFFSNLYPDIMRMYQQHFAFICH